MWIRVAYGYVRKDMWCVKVGGRVELLSRSFVIVSEMGLALDVIAS